MRQSFLQWAAMTREKRCVIGGFKIFDPNEYSIIETLQNLETRNYKLKRTFFSILR
jgi:hypothetical protein